LIDVSLIILCAGNSTRFEHKSKKQWLRIDNEPLWLYVANRLNNNFSFKEIIIVSSPLELNYMKNFSDDYIYTTGGDTRQQSLKNALQIVTSSKVMVTDVARSCVPFDVLNRLIQAKDEADCIVPILDVSDTVVYGNETINRDEVKLVQTPQLSDTNILKNALNTNIEYTDDSSAIKANNGSVKYIKGDTQSKKLTFGSELKDIDCLKEPSKNFFTGFGYDVHAFEDKKPMFLGGVNIPCDYGFKAHSDGDVLIHSIIDALLGAIGAGDIGEFFPDTEEKYKGADSKILLQEIVSFVQSVGYEIVNIDALIVAQQPKINPHKQEIKSSLAKIINLPKQFINIKATTSEKMGFIGRKEGVAVHSVATLKYYNWMEKQ